LLEFGRDITGNLALAESRNSPVARESDRGKIGAMEQAPAVLSGGGV
jgi:hypothetical protein